MRPSSSDSSIPLESLSPQVYTLNNTFVHDEGGRNKERICVCVRMVYAGVMYVHVYVQVCMPTQTCGGQRRTSEGILYHPLINFFRLVAIKSPKSFVLPNPTPNTQCWGNKHGM